MPGVKLPRPVWYRFKDGKIISKQGDVETVYDGIQGRIVAVRVMDETYEGETYKKIQINMEGSGELSVLQMKLDSGYGRSFCYLALSIDYSKEVIISGSSKQIDGKTRTRMFIKQGEKFLKQFFTKADPKDLPPVTAIESKGKIVGWDFEEQQKFFIAMFEEINKALNVSAVPLPEAPKLERGEHGISDDLPF